MLSKFSLTSNQLEGLGLFSLVTTSLILLTNLKTKIPVSQSNPNTNKGLIKYWETKDEENDFLKEVLSEESLAWVKQQNSICVTRLGDPTDYSIYDRILNILDCKDKIPHVSKIGNYYYNFWQDDKNLRGIFRRTTLASFKSINPDWEVILDLDQLGQKENESWVYKSYTLCNCDSNEDPYLLLFHLSRGGKDATVIREFDLKTKTFVEKDPFNIPESKTFVSYKSKNKILFGTDMNDGESMTDSGYPRIVREWERGQPIEKAKIIFCGENTDILVHGYRTEHQGVVLEWIDQAITFYTSKKLVCLIPESNQFYELNVPIDAEVSHFGDQLLIWLRSDWEHLESKTKYSKGSLLSGKIVDFIEENDKISLDIIFEPTASTSIDTYLKTKDYLILSIIDNVKTRLVLWKYENSQWVYCGSEPEPLIRGISISSVDSHHSNLVWLTSNSFIQPTKLFLIDVSNGAKGLEMAESVKELPRQFDFNNELKEQQFFAISKDGTKVPYFIVHPKTLEYNGENPTLIYGYGGFEISMLPSYTATVGSTWLSKEYISRPTCYVVANIRGGGEYGPSWHQAALKANRQNAYDDFIAVAEDLIKRKITNHQRIGIRGGSNGGLLMGNMFVQRPDLFKAVCCQVPLLDMKCYNKLLAGASWMAEYGDPDKSEDWEYLQRYSAYHNIDPSKVQHFPFLLMTTSTKDDRVHPYHARSFVKRVKEIENASNDNSKVFYYENIEGGHGGAADNKQQAFMTALYIDFMKKYLC